MAGEIDRKIELIAAAEDELFTALKGIDQQLAREIIKLYSKFVVGGELVLNAAELAQLEDSIISAVAATDYRDAVNTYIPNFDAIKNLNKDIHKDLNKIDAAAVLDENDKIANFQSAVEAQLRGTNAVKIRVTENGIKSVVNIPNKSLDELIQPIADIIRTDVIQGISFEAATEGILDAISKKQLGLERYAGQIARDALNQADGIQNDEIRKEFDLEYVRYVGTIATNTRPVCYHFMTEKRVIKYEDLQKELDQFIPNGIPSESTTNKTPTGKREKKGGGMIPGTDANNWLVRRGGYNCRHTAIAARRPEE